MASKRLVVTPVDRSRYEPKTINVCEVLACYFLDKIYNDIYLRVKDLKVSSKIQSLTEGYRQALLLYFRNLKKPENFRKCIQGIHQLFIETPGFSNMMLRQCVFYIASQFSPKQDFDGFTEKQKQAVARKVIINVNSAFITHVLEQRLGMVIDNRKQKNSVVILKDELINLFLLERERLLNEYYGVVLGAGKGTVSKNMADSLKNMVRDAVKDKVIAERKAKKYYELAQEYKNKLDKLQKEVNPSANTTASDIPTPLSGPSGPSGPSRPGGSSGPNVPNASKVHNIAEEELSSSGNIDVTKIVSNPRKSQAKSEIPNISIFDDDSEENKKLQPARLSQPPKISRVQPTRSNVPNVNNSGTSYTSLMDISSVSAESSSDDENMYEAIDTGNAGDVEENLLSKSEEHIDNEISPETQIPVVSTESVNSNILNREIPDDDDDIGIDSDSNGLDAFDFIETEDNAFISPTRPDKAPVAATMDRPTKSKTSAKVPSPSAKTEKTPVNMSAKKQTGTPTKTNNTSSNKSTGTPKIPKTNSASTKKSTETPKESSSREPSRESSNKEGKSSKSGKPDKQASAADTKNQTKGKKAKVTFSDDDDLFI